MNELLQWIATGLIVAVAAVIAARSLWKRRKGGCGCSGSDCKCSSDACSGCPLTRNCNHKSPRK